MTERIIDFNKKIEERQNISIVKKENEIQISGWEGIMYISLDLPIYEKKEKTKIFAKLITKFFKSKKKQSEIEVKVISEEDFKKMLFQDIKFISWKGETEETREKIWDKIKDKILSAKNFQCQVIKGNIADLKKPFTCTSSYIFCIKNSSNQ